MYTVLIWFIGAVRSDMDDHIESNKLKTSGIYAWVRNPMYSGWWIAYDIPGNVVYTVNGKGSYNEIYKTWKFGFARIPYMHGLHGIWRCDERTAQLDDR